MIGFMGVFASVSVKTGVLLMSKKCNPTKGSPASEDLPVGIGRRRELRGMSCRRFGETRASVVASRRKMLVGGYERNGIGGILTI